MHEESLKSFLLGASNDWTSQFFYTSGVALQKLLLQQNVQVLYPETETCQFMLTMANLGTQYISILPNSCVRNRLITEHWPLAWIISHLRKKCQGPTVEETARHIALHFRSSQCVDWFLEQLPLYFNVFQLFYVCYIYFVCRLFQSRWVTKY